MVAGHGGGPLVGTPEQIVEGLLARSKAGLDGAAISWVNYAEGLEQFHEQILPLMIEAGLRVNEDEPEPAILPGQATAPTKV
jgi:dimethylsulfone monooxygenase